MTSEEFRRSIHPREHPRFILALFFAVPAAIAFLIVVWMTSGLALTIVLYIAFIVWLAYEVTYAMLIANWILVSEHNYPRVHALLMEMKERIGVTGRIDVIIFEMKQFNAVFQALFARRAIFIPSELLEKGVTDDEIRWILGRFIGRIRAKKRMGILSAIISATEYIGVFNLFIYPYVRATAYSGDRIGLSAINGDLSAAISAMNKMMVGRELGYSVNPAGIVVQYRRVKGSLFAFLARIASPLPHTIARYVDLIGFAERRFPNAYQEFAAMNPSFQMSGGPYGLLRAGPAIAEDERSFLAASMGWLLLGGMLATGALVAVLAATNNGNPIRSLPFLGARATPPPAFESSVDQTAESPAAQPPSPFDTTGPAPEAPPYDSKYANATPPAGTYFGAFAVSDRARSWSGGYDYASSQDAIRGVVNDCAARNAAAGDCRVILTFGNGCGALAADGELGVWGVGRGATDAEAGAAARADCNRSGGSVCEVQRALCTTRQ